MAQKSIDFILRVLKQGTGASQATSDLQKLDGQTEKTKRGLSVLDGVAIAAGQQIVSLGMSALRSVPDLVKQGVAINRARTALEAYAGSTEEADRFIEEMSRAVGGSINNLGLMQNATRLLSMGLADTATEAAEMTDIAVTLGATMGKGPQEAFEEFTLLLANQSILRLDTFGISGAAVRQRMQELADEGIAPADRQMRFMTATMEEATKKMNALDAAGFEATSSIDKLGAMVDNAKQGVASWLADGLVPLFDGIVQLKEGIDEKKRSVVEITSSYEEYTRVMDEQHPLIGKLTEAEFEAQKQQEFLNIAIQKGEEMQRIYADQVRDTTGATNEYAAATDDLKLSIVGLSQADIARKAIESLDESYDLLGPELYNQALIDIHTSMIGTPNAQIVASLALQNLQAEFAKTGDLDEYIRKVKELGFNIENIPEWKKVTIEVETIYRESGRSDVPFPMQHGGQFMVGGPPGPDRSPVFFWATRGEMVTVTPAGQPAPPSPTTNNYFTMNSYSNAPVDQTIANFELMKALT